MTDFYCAGGCGTVVRGIYCEKHRAERQFERMKLRDEKSARLKRLWLEDREKMLAAIKDGRAAAKESEVSPKEEDV